uniref:Uncharacterized protein n=1 Tax=Aegilops tauschii subsp. strangulata TaxID=200361 RepID=A0A453HGL2_AEGTS
VCYTLFRPIMPPYLALYQELNFLKISLYSNFCVQGILQGVSLY